MADTAFHFVAGSFQGFRPVSAQNHPKKTKGPAVIRGLLYLLESLNRMVGGTWIEHVTPTMSTWCSTAELTAHTISLKRGWVYREASSIASFRLLGARYDLRF
jgi:hypothetical protein